MFNRLGGRPSPKSARNTGPIAAWIIITMSLLGACSGDEPEPTQAELLSAIEGRQLTAAEVDEREEVAALLCTLDDEVLQRIWTKLSPEELAFQDYVFGRVCGDRSNLYGQATGRFATEPDDS